MAVLPTLSWHEEYCPFEWECDWVRVMYFYADQTSNTQFLDMYKRISEGPPHRNPCGEMPAE